MTTVGRGGADHLHDHQPLQAVAREMPESFRTIADSYLYVICVYIYTHMYVCMYIYIYIYICIHTYIHTCIYVHILRNVEMHKRGACELLRDCSSTLKYINTKVILYDNDTTHICIHRCVCVYTYIHIYTLYL